MKPKKIALFGGIAAAALAAGTLGRRWMKRKHARATFLEMCRGFVLARTGRTAGYAER
jgi:hypothetical protein